MLIQPVKDTLVLHELPNGSMAPRLEQRVQALRDQPLAILGCNQGDQGLPEQPANDTNTLGWGVPHKGGRMVPNWLLHSLQEAA